MRRLFRRTPGTPKKRFWTETPSHRNAVDLFAGDWVSDLGEVVPQVAHAGIPLFVADVRPAQAAQALGDGARFDRMSILELGPLEGAHCYQLEKLGAGEIVSIESNANAFVRCVVVKNMLGLDRTTFLLGDCAAYLQDCDRSFDLIFACGILYHMKDPVELIRLMAKRTRKVFLWTQYFDPSFRDGAGKPLPHRPVRYEQDGLALTLYELTYGRRSSGAFYGGNTDTARWLTLEDILSAFRHCGFDAQTTIGIDRQGERGPAATLAFERTAMPTP